MSVSKKGDMYVAIVHSTKSPIGVFQHHDRLSAMKMASAYAFGSQ